jgi:hypothetical protein
MRNYVSRTATTTSGSAHQRQKGLETHPRLELRSFLLFFFSAILCMATGTIARSTQLSIDDDCDFVRGLRKIYLMRSFMIQCLH